MTSKNTLRRVIHEFISAIGEKNVIIIVFRDLGDAKYRWFYGQKK